LEVAVKLLYRKSWISKYFNVDVKSEDGVVFFYDNAKKSRFISSRFLVALKIPDITKQFFKPKAFWNDIPLLNWIRSDYLSEIEHGLQTNNARGTKTEIYTPPFFLFFKMPRVTTNFLSFNDYIKPNTEATILSLLQYDEDRNRFFSEYNPELILLYNTDLCLSEVLEFSMYDCKNQLIQVSDKSQLFIEMTLLSEEYK